MPEGDTVHRAAGRLHAVLTGRRLGILQAPRLGVAMPPVGVTVTCIEARGKHLLVRFDDGHVLHTHLGMNGSWRTSTTATPLRVGRSRVRVVLADDRVRAVCLDAPVVELLDEPAVQRHPMLRRLGPDLCRPEVDLDVVATAMARQPAARPLVDVLLDQSVAAGIGNVYASELAFLSGHHPLTSAGEVSAADWRHLVADAARLLRENIVLPRRTTVPGEPPGALWVYGRAGRPCRRCATTIITARLGTHVRPTWWCPSCQPGLSPVER
jgi:endonuclease VIII